MDIHSKPVIGFRWVVFLLAAGYTIHEIAFSSYEHFSGPFRYLTIWALLMSFYAASRMLAVSEHRITRPHQVTAMVAAVLNVMVVYLYWKLWFTDPALVNNNGPIIWYREYYLHGLGPALQIIDALFVGRVFARTWRAAIPLVAIIGLYVFWSELVVQRFSQSSPGSVTSGLPYPFLNSMELGERVGFYGLNLCVALGLLVVFGILGLIFRHQARYASPA
jgi:hypothetical protein